MAVEAENDQTRVAPALLPVLASLRRTLQNKQECLCHTNQNHKGTGFIVGKKSTCTAT
jgi:hypothetical protein